MQKGFKELGFVSYKIDCVLNEAFWCQVESYQSQYEYYITVIITTNDVPIKIAATTPAPITIIYSYFRSMLPGMHLVLVRETRRKHSTKARTQYTSAYSWELF